MADKVIFYKLVTPYATRYVFDEHGCILRYDDSKFTCPHNSWRIVGICEILPFNNLHFIPLAKVLIDMKNGIKYNWKFKNGKPRYTVQDIDHGTLRTWGNWNVHGISYIKEIQENEINL